MATNSDSLRHSAIRPLFQTSRSKEVSDYTSSQTSSSKITARSPSGPVAFLLFISRIFDYFRPLPLGGQNNSSQGFAHADKGPNTLACGQLNLVVLSPTVQPLTFTMDGPAISIAHDFTNRSSTPTAVTYELKQSDCYLKQLLLPSLQLY